MSAWGRAATALILAAIVAMLSPTRSGSDAPAGTVAPLTNEDIVRMVVSGTSEREIKDTIQSRPESFDLTDDMVVELKLAGVSDALVAAMAQRHAQSVPAPPPVGRTRRGHVSLVVILNPAGSGSRSLRVPSWADEDARARFHLPKENEQREVKDLAVFLACTAPEHIPDLWRSKTPLGRDMVAVPRHEMLAFFAGDTPAGKAPRLVLPPRIEAEVDDDEPHDLVLGVAARIGDRWMQLAVGVLPKVTIGAGSKPLIGRIERAGHAFDFKIELTAPRSPAS